MAELKWILKRLNEGRINLSTLGQGQVAGSRVKLYEPWGSIKCGKFSWLAEKILATKKGHCRTQLKKMQFYYPHSEDTVLWIITWVSLENRALPVVNTIIVSWQHICSKEKYLFFRGYCNLDLCRQYKWCTFNDNVTAIRPQWLQKNRAIEGKIISGNHR
jgi:hypothetical protein